jgi:hypothetical protein
MDDGWCSDQNVRLEYLVSKIRPTGQEACRSVLKSVWCFIILDSEDRVIYPCKGWIKGSNILHLLNCLLDGEWHKAEDILLFVSLLIRSVHAPAS